MGLVHLWIPFLLLIVCENGSMDNGGIYYRALPQQQALLFQVLLHRLEDLLGQVMLFHKVVERQDGGGIWDVIFGKINAGEAADGAGVNQGIETLGNTFLARSWLFKSLAIREE